jgi:hypothetical protein
MEGTGREPKHPFNPGLKPALVANPMAALFFCRALLSPICQTIDAWRPWNSNFGALAR